MEEKIKERLFGAIILVALGIIFIPMLFDDKASDAVNVNRAIPEAPAWPETEELLIPSTRLAPVVSDEAQTVIAPRREAEAEVTTAPTLQLAVPEPVAEVITDVVPKAETAPKKSAVLAAYSVQVGTFGNTANAKKLAADLKVKGLPAYVLDTTVGGKPALRVMVGPESSKQDADKLAQRLTTQHQLNGFVVQYDPRD